MKRILLADDHSIVRTGIRSLISEHCCGCKVDEAGDDIGIVAAVRNCRYDLLILDINMGDCDFVKLMDWLTATALETAILIFTMHPEDLYGIHCLQLGARGYLHKTASDREIVHAIRTVLEGKKYINPVMVEILSHNAGNNALSSPFQYLSSRETEIALLLHGGRSLPEICDILSIQYSTANTYKRRIFEKLNVNNILSLSRLMQTFNIQQ